MKFFLDILLFLPLLILFILESFVRLFIPKRRKSVTGEVVLITGAGHGIGRLTAFEFAKLKSKLVLWDINKHGLEETATECKRLGARVHHFVVDCSNREDIYSSAKKVKAEIGDVSILVNNAGVVYTSDLFATQDPQIEKTFEVNVLAHFWTTKVFLPAMTKNNHGHIVTVASAAGHSGVPFLMAYCSSKFAAVGFHCSLTEELTALGITGVKTTCLCPNFINTGFIKIQVPVVVKLKDTYIFPGVFANHIDAQPDCHHPQDSDLVDFSCGSIVVGKRAWNPMFNKHNSLGQNLEPEEVVNKLMAGILTEQKLIFVPSSLRFLILMERILPERFLAILKQKINIKFDAVIGYKAKEK